MWPRCGSGHGLNGIGGDRVAPDTAGTAPAFPADHIAGAERRARLPRKKVPNLPQLRGPEEISRLWTLDMASPGALPSSERLRKIQNDKKLLKLAKHYGLALDNPNACYELLLRVCIDFVSGFKDPTVFDLKSRARRGGSKKKWSPELNAKLVSEVDRRRRQKKKISQACEALANKGFKGRKASTLSRRYRLLKRERG